MKLSNLPKVTELKIPSRVNANINAYDNCI